MDHQQVPIRRGQSMFTKPVSNEPSQSIFTKKPVSIESGQSIFTKPVSNEPGQSIFTKKPVSNEPSQSIFTKKPVSNEPGQSIFTKKLVSNEPGQSMFKKPVSSEPGQSMFTRKTVSNEPSQSIFTKPISNEPGQSMFGGQSMFTEPVSSELEPVPIRRHQSMFSGQSMFTKPVSNQPEGVPLRPTPIEFVNCYSSHRDKVKEVKRYNKPFLCNGCKESGFKSRYRCEPCNFDLHPACIFAKRTISPEIFHEELVFEFRPEGPQPPEEKLCDACGEKLCDACGEKIHGCFYNCKAKGMDLHPCCARLKAQVRNHDMVLLLCKKASSECLRCRKKESPAPGTKWGTPGWCYVSVCKKYNIHIFCIAEMLHQAWKEGHTDHTGGNSISNINLDQMALPHGNRGGRGTEALKIIDILRIGIGILVGDPSALLGNLMLEILQQLP